MARALLPPGFRFHPTDVELVWYYLKRKIMGKNQRFETISVVELYKFAPWDLPEKSCLRSNDLQWHFFCPRDKKYSQGSRTNRATDIGFWKTTGKDRTVIHKDQIVGKKKTLIFHLGKLPQGSRTNWVMYEFRLQSEQLANAGYTQDAFVLCKIFEKSGPGPRNGEQYGAPFKEEDWEDDTDFENANLFCPLPLQSAAPEVGEPSSMLCNFEVGEPSSRRDHSAVDGLSSMPDISEVEEPLAMLERSGIGELSSIQGLSEVAGPYPMLEHLDIGELSSLQGLSEVGGPYSVLEPSGVREGSSVQAAVEFPYVPEPFPDGFSWQRLEAYLDSHLPHSGDAAGEMPESGIMLNDFIQAPSLENENIYSDLQDLCVPPSLEPADAVTPNDMMNYDQWLLHPALAEFAEGEYIRLSDMDFTGEGYPMKYNAVTNDTSLNGAGNIPLSSESQAQLPGPAVSADQLPSTSENDICQGRIRKGKAPP